MLILLFYFTSTSKIGLGLVGCASLGCSVMPKRRASNPSSKLLWWATLPQKINLISCGPIAHVSDIIKLIRTDTTLDLREKAEKGMNFNCSGLVILYSFPQCCFLFPSMWDNTKLALLSSLLDLK